MSILLLSISNQEVKYMEVLITYDVSTETSAGRKRLRKVAQICQDYGQRVQKSVFECSVNQINYEIMLNKLINCIDEKMDTIRVYRLREPKENHVVHYGIGESIDFNDTLIL